MEDSKLKFKDYYGATAQYYDGSYQNYPTKKDIDFYLELAKSVDGKVLEVACGTGRVLIPTAAAGINIDGLDYSEDLLTILKQKLATQSLETQQRVQLYQADMRNFSLEKQYDLITVPFRPFQHMYFIEDQIQALECFSKHLKTGAKLALNVFFPDYKWLANIGNEVSDFTWSDPQNPKLIVKRSYIIKKVDRLLQNFELEFKYKSYLDNELIKEEVSPFLLAYFTYPHMQLLFKQTGFKILEEYGSYEKDPISICKEMIFICEKAN